MKKIVLLCIFIVASLSITYTAVTIRLNSKTVSQHTSIKNKTENNDVLVLKSGNVIDGTGRSPIANSLIIIKAGKITFVGKTGEIKYPSDAKIIDLKGSTVLPGFINAHVHQAYDVQHLQTWLKAGITTVRDLNPRQVKDFTKERDTLNNDAKNAFIVSGTPILKVEGGYGYGTKYITSPEDAKNDVLDYISMGADIIKFSIEDNLPPGSNWGLLSDTEINSIIDTAHSKNKKVSVHVSRYDHLKQAVDLGVDDISHMIVDPLDSKIIAEIIKKDIYIVPTLELWNGVGWGNMATTNLGDFYKAGGKIALGTDFAGYTCHFDEGFPVTEVKLMKNAGMSNMDIILAGTKNAAHVCDLDNEIGTIEVGKKADILIVNGNPLLDITDLAKTKMVIHNGKLVQN